MRFESKILGWMLSLGILVGCAGAPWVRGVGELPGDCVESASPASRIPSRSPARNGNISALQQGIDLARAHLHRSHRSALGRAVAQYVDWALIDGHLVHAMTHAGGHLVVGTSGGLLTVEEDTVVDRKTILEGLRENHVKALTTDDMGRVWISFADGGCQIQVEDSLLDCPSILDTRRITSWTQHQGSLYGVTWEGELFRIEENPDLEAIQVLFVTPSGSLPMAHRLVSCGGDLWVGSLGSGIGLLTQLGEWSIDRTDRVVEGLACIGDTVYVGGPAGLMSYRAGHREAVSLVAGPQQVRSLIPAEDRLFVALVDGRLLQMGPDLEPAGAVVATATQGSIRWAGQDREWLDAPATDQVLSVQCTYDLPGAPTTGATIGDTLWLGREGGLYRMGLAGVDTAGTPEWFEVELPGPGSIDIAAIAADGEDLALGMFRDGVAIWRAGQWHRVTTSDGLSSDEVNALAYDESGQLWVATSRGLAVVDGNGWVRAAFSTPQLPCQHMNGLSTTRLPGLEHQVLVVASSCGVGLIDTAEGRVLRWEHREEGLPHRIAYTVTEWQGRLVVGTNDGLAVREAFEGPDLSGSVVDGGSGMREIGQASDPDRRVPRQGESDRPWTRYLAGEIPLTDNFITALTVTSTGDLVVGTYSGGVYLGADPQGLQRLAGPQYINPNALLGRSEGLWVGGLYEGAFLLTEGWGTHWRRGPELVGADVTGFAVWGGSLLLATRSGVTRRSLQPASTPVTVALMAADRE